jgi:hypothetical protein
VLLETGQVLFAGGASGPGGNSGILASAELYHPTTGTFSLTGSMTVPRSKHNAVLLASGQVLVMGGVNPSVSGPLASAELYDPTSGTFSLTGSMTIPRFFVFPTVVLLPDGQVLVAGGADNGPVASAELYIGFPTDKDQCKNGGWMTLFQPDGSPFKNQGDCIQFVNNGK